MFGSFRYYNNLFGTHALRLFFISFFFNDYLIISRIDTGIISVLIQYKYNIKLIF